MVGGYIVSAALLDVLSAAAAAAAVARRTVGVREGGKARGAHTPSRTRTGALRWGGTRAENRLGPDNRNNSNNNHIYI